MRLYGKRELIYEWEWRTLRLPKRLMEIAALIPEEGSVVDVGTDHGFLPVWLALGGERRITATDINAAPLSRAVSAAEDAGVGHKIRFVLCDGLDGCEPSDVVVIAGMGGETIARILERAAWTREALLFLQPMSKAETLRQWLYENGYNITREVLVKDSGVIYPILSAVGGDAPVPNSAELHYGVNVRQDDLFREHLTEIIQKAERRLSGLEASRKPDDLRRREETARLLADVRQALALMTDAKREGNI